MTKDLLGGKETAMIVNPAHLEMVKEMEEYPFEMSTDFISQIIIPSSIKIISYLLTNFLKCFLSSG